MTPALKKGFGFIRCQGFADHGPTGTGEPPSEILRAGNAGSNTVADQIRVISQVLAQLPGRHPRGGSGRKVLVRLTGVAGRMSSWAG
jgi:hypothetical protein